jgi:serine/threonine protein kinase
MIMVLEYADGGSLHDKVIGIAADSAPDMQQLISWLCEVSEGMRVLHNQAKPILHCDLKPDNVLLKLNMANRLVAVISDFGLAKVRRGFFCMVLFLGDCMTRILCIMPLGTHARRPLFLFPLRRVLSHVTGCMLFRFMPSLATHASSYHWWHCPLHDRQSML